MNLFDFYIPDWLFVALNLLILIWVLKKILWKPMNKIIEERQQKAAKTEQDSEEAAKIRAEVEQLRQNADTEMEAYTAERMKEARIRAGREYDRIINEAEGKSEQIISAAKTKAVQEQERVMTDMKKQIVSISMEAASFLLRSIMDGDKNKQIVEAYLTEKDVSA